MSALTRHLLLCLSLAWGGCACAAEPLPEYTVKAGYLYNFAMLTEWPSEAAGENLELCLIGDDEFGAALKMLQGKAVNQRFINVRNLNYPGEAKGCHMLFIAEVARPEFVQIKRELAARPVLTITDNKNLEKSGVAIFLRAEQRRLVFEIDTGATKNAKLNLSARLLRLARGAARE